MPLDLFKRRREFRARVESEAGDLMRWLGDGAYGEARNRAREARRRGDQGEYVLWCKVAVEIAGRIGYEIGVKGADRYPPPPPRPDPKRREIADRLVEIGRGMTALSAGRAEPTTVHNIGVAARQILDFTGRSPALEAAVADVIAACEAVTLPPTREALHAGVYPPAVEAAGKALQRLRGLVLP